LGALTTSIFIGWFASRTIVNDQLSETTPLWRTLTVVLLRYVCPLAIATVFIASFV
jgi:SNF family Na+-dependent transporter